MVFSKNSSFPLAQRVAVVSGILAMVAGGFWWQYRENSPSQQRTDAGLRALQAGNRALAESQWREAVSLDANNAGAWEMLGDFYLSSQNWALATKTFETVAKIAPQTPQLPQKLARAYWESSQYLKAQKLAQLALREDAKNLTMWEIVAESARVTKQRDLQMQTLQKMLEIAPDDQQNLDLMAQELARRGEFDKALPVTEHLVQLDATSPHFLFMRAVARFTIGSDAAQIEGAKKDFIAVLELEPDNVAARRYLGRIYLRENQSQKAIEQFEAIGRGRPFASAHLLELASAYRMAGNEKRAAQLQTRFASLKQFNTRSLGLKDRIKRAPQNPQNYLALGRMLLDAVNLDEGTFQLYRYRFSTRELHDVGYYFDRALELEPQNRALQKASTSLESDYQRILQNGNAALKKQDNPTAFAQFSRLVVLRPDDKRTLNVAQQLEPLGYKIFPEAPQTAN